MASRDRALLNALPVSDDGESDLSWRLHSHSALRSRPPPPPPHPHRHRVAPDPRGSGAPPNVASELRDESDERDEEGDEHHEDDGSRFALHTDVDAGSRSRLRTVKRRGTSRRAPVGDESLHHSPSPRNQQKADDGDREDLPLPSSGGATSDDEQDPSLVRYYVRSGLPPSVMCCAVSGDLSDVMMRNWRGRFSGW